MGISGSLLEYVAQESTNTKKCVLERARDALSKENREELDHMLDNIGTQFTVSQITRALNAVGTVQLSRASVDYHIRQSCVCYR